MEDIKMKKTYIAPETLEHKINIESLLNINSLQRGEADSNATGMAREGGLVWELEEVSEEE